MVDKDVLTSEVCHAVLTKLAFLASSGQKSALESVGMSTAHIAKLENSSYRELDKWIKKRKGHFDIEVLVEGLFPESDFDMPPEQQDFLLHGANNKMMKHFFGTRAEDCSTFRESLTLEKPFRARSITHKKHGEICKALQKHGDYRQLTAEALLEVAQTHQVSLGALWNEIKKWEKESEQENKA